MTNYKFNYTVSGDKPDVNTRIRRTLNTHAQPSLGLLHLLDPNSTATLLALYETNSTFRGIINDAAIQYANTYLSAHDKLKQHANTVTITANIVTEQIHKLS